MHARPMTWDDLTAAREQIGLTNRQMAQLLGVGLSTYEGWGVRGKIPRYIQHSVEAHLALGRAALREIIGRRVP
ncbi:MAG: helix-turn-helix domain-containing protein [Pseudomonadota bacterium]